MPVHRPPSRTGCRDTPPVSMDARHQHLIARGLRRKHSGERSAIYGVRLKLWRCRAEYRPRHHRSRPQGRELVPKPARKAAREASRNHREPLGLAPHVVLLARQSELRLVLTRNRSAKTVEVIAKRDLARQARRLVAIGRAVEEIVLVRTHGRDLPGKLGRDVDVTRRTGTASSAKREQFVETMLADYFHQVEACIRFEGVRFACAVDDRQARRPFDSIKTVQIRNSLADWCAAA